MDLNAVSVTAIFWIAIAVIGVAGSFFSYMSRAARYRMLQSLAEKGQTLPPEVLANLADANASPRNIRAGVILVCIGIALAFFLWSMTSPVFDGPIPHLSWLPSLGVFPFMIGVGLLLIAAFDRSPPSRKS